MEHPGQPSNPAATSASKANKFVLRDGTIQELKTGAAKTKPQPKKEEAQQDNELMALLQIGVMNAQKDAERKAAKEAAHKKQVQIDAEKAIRKQEEAVKQQEKAVKMQAEARQKKLLAEAEARQLLIQKKAATHRAACDQTAEQYARSMNRTTAQDTPGKLE